MIVFGIWTGFFITVYGAIRNAWVYNERMRLLDKYHTFCIKWISHDVDSYENFMVSRTIETFYGSYYKWMFTFWSWDISTFIIDKELERRIKELDFTGEK